MLEELERPEIAEIADILVMNDASRTLRTGSIKAHDIRWYPMSLIWGTGAPANFDINTRSAANIPMIQMDADGQHDVQHTGDLSETTKQRGCGRTLPGYRALFAFYGGSAEYSVSATKKLAYGFFRWMIKISTGRKIADPTTGLQGLNRRAFYITRSISTLTTSIRMPI